MPQLIVIHLLRRPLVGTVAANALKYGTGGLNIDACRIGTEDSLGGGAYAENPSPRPNPEEWRFKRGGAKPKSLLRTQNRQDNGGSMNPGVWQGGTTGSVNGRWPANLILQHEPGCRKVGEHYEEFSLLNYTDSTSGNFSFFTENQEERPEVEETVTGQVVEDWQCVEGCPCLDLDRQSGVLTSGKPVGTRHGVQSKTAGVYSTNHSIADTPLTGFGDEGGASRFFKQIADRKELLRYLQVLISPPKTETSPWAAVWDQWPVFPETQDSHSQVGVILNGFVPTAAQTADLYRILYPGGHVCLVAPDDQPTGHTGAIRLEDAGFEVRDAILWVRGPGRVHYVAKAARKEREAGCSKLPAKKGFEAVEREEGSAGVQNPRAGAGRTAGKVHNFHPCLHPEAVVMTDRGHRQIQTIQIGDKVLAQDGRFHPVEAVTRHPYTSEFLYQIRVKGTNLTTLASDNHPFLIWRPVRKGNRILDGQVVWVRADQMVKGDYTLTPLVSEGSGPQSWPVDPNFWFVFGLWLAEGVSQKAGHGNNCYPSFSLHRNETHLVDRIKALIPPSRDVAVYEHGENGIQVMAFDPVLGAQFKTLGGSGAATKTIHPEVWSLTEVQRRALVEGYLAGDGGQVRGYIQAKSVSTDLATQMTFLAESLGYKTNLFWFKAAPGKIKARHFKTTSPHYQMQFYSKDRMQTARKPASPALVTHEGVVYTLRYVQGVLKAPYHGDVVNLSVEGCPTFQTAVGMSHNTVKPIALMKKLLSDVPQDRGPVIDPFVGSGTTMVACIQTGHSGIGIERDPEYMGIARARVQCWNSRQPPGCQATIPQSDQPVEPAEREFIELDDIFE